MSGLIAASSIEEVKERADILDVVSGIMTLKRAGKEHVGLCPLPDHEEKTASFYVYPEENRWHCYGCSRGGDVIELYMGLTGAGFVEAVEHLADGAGITLEYEGGTDAEREAAKERAELRKEALRALEASAKHYRETLLKGADAKARAAYEYLTRARGLAPETLETYGVGYAHPGQGFCAVAGEKHGVGEEALEAARLANERGRDFFARRITFPIRDARGRVGGFGGRAVSGDDTWIDREGKKQTAKKYLNSHESDLFKKRQLLYGLDVAMGAIRKTGSAVVVEGYTDVLALHQAGIKNAVATLGTETTPEHVEALARHTKRVTLVFDSDKAGQKAVERAKDAAARKLDLRVLLLGEKDMDPAKWLLEHSGEEFEALLEAAPDVVEWEINRAVGSARGATRWNARGRLRACRT